MIEPVTPQRAIAAKIACIQILGWLAGGGRLNIKAIEVHEVTDTNDPV